MTQAYLSQTAINLIAAPVFVLLVGLLREPFRRRSMAALLGVAALVYARGGLGDWEWPLGVAIAAMAVWGLRWYPALGIGWLLHALSDVLHHNIGHPMVTSLPLSSFGCAVLDPLIAIWFFAGAPSTDAMIGNLRRRFGLAAKKQEPFA